jgi:hypothetical protein
MTESERIRKIIDYYDVSANKLSIQLRLGTPQVLYDVLKGKNGISKDLAEKITIHCKEFNPGWLLTGEGEMLKSNKSVNNSVEYWRDLVDYYVQELEAKRKEYKELREELNDIKTELAMLKLERKKKDFDQEV